jgi:hypothetical protein
VPKTSRALRHETTWLRSFLKYNRRDVGFAISAMADMQNGGFSAVDIRNALRNPCVLSSEPHEGPMGEASWLVEGRDADDRKMLLELHVQAHENDVEIVRVLPL